MKTISLSHLQLPVLYCLKQPAAKFHNYADEKSHFHLCLFMDNSNAVLGASIVHVHGSA